MKSDDVYYAPAEEFSIGKKNVEVGEMIAEGRFAVVRKGRMTAANDVVTVAVKALKSRKNSFL